jgi:hypothetical protein
MKMNPQRLASLKQVGAIVKSTRGPTRPSSAKTRSFCIAFDYEDVADRGGQEMLEGLVKVLIPRSPFSISKVARGGQTFLKASFSSDELATRVYQGLMVRFIEAFVAGGEKWQRVPARNPPRPSFWLGHHRDGGYECGDLMGLVVWTLPLQADVAVREVVRRVCTRMGCDEKALPLFIDLNLRVDVEKDAFGKPLTTIRVLANQRSTALAIRSSGDELDSQCKALVTSDLLLCDICQDGGHHTFTCPKPKLRIRLKHPFNITVRSQIVELLKLSGISVLGIWGGRNPLLGGGTRRFGYVAFRSDENRMLADTLLTHRWAEKRLLEGPILLVGTGLLVDECGRCGCNPIESLSPRRPLHTPKEKCPLDRFSRANETLVNITGDWVDQIPTAVRQRQGPAQSVKPTEVPNGSTPATAPSSYIPSPGTHVAGDRL